MKSALVTILLSLALAGIAAAAIDEALIQELTGIAPNPERKPAELEELYLKGFAELKDFVETKVASKRTWAQRQLHEMVTYVSAPEREDQRKIFCSAIAKQLEVSDYSPVGRTILIRALGDIGGPDSVPALVKLLSASDPNEAELGRMSLQSIPGSESEKALIDGLKSATGNTRMTLGLVDSISARQPHGAVSSLAPLLDNPAPEVVAATATALGRIGGADATKALGKARSSTVDTKMQEKFEQGLLSIANLRGASGDRVGAGKIFQVLHQQTKSDFVRTAAMLGLARATPAAADEVVIEALRSSDARTKAAGIGASILVPSQRLTKGLAAMLDTSPKPVQLQILNALAMKGDQSVQDKVVEFLAKAESEDRKTRSRRNPKELEVAAIEALGPLGNVKVVELLLSKSVDNEEQIRDAAGRALGQIKDKSLVQTIEYHAREGKTPKIRAVAIGLFMRNRDRTGLTRMMSFAAEPDKTVSHAAFSVLRQEAGDPEFRKLLNLYRANKPGVMPVLIAVCGRAKNPSLVTSEIVTFVRSTENNRQHRFVIGLLPMLGSANGLTLVKEMLGEGKKNHDAALRALAKWPDPIALPTMMRTLEAEKDENLVVGLMAKGIARLVAASPDLTVESRVHYIGDTFDLCKNTRERTLLLPVLGELPHPRSVDLIDSMLTDRYVYAYAGSAAANLCGKLVKTDPDAARALATKVMKGKFGSKVKRKAETALAQIKDGKPMPKDPDQPFFE